jgi:uncharacterized membrane protein
MAFCGNCGSEATGRFCEQCGANLEAPDAVIRLESEARPEGAPLPENAVCALCYFLFFLSAAAFLMWPPYSENKKVRFHAFQSILFTAAWMTLVYTVGVILPFGLSQIVFPVVQLGVLAIWVHIMWQVYHEREVVLPVLGDFARKHA